jgi:hypothetical protein
MRKVTLFLVGLVGLASMSLGVNAGCPTSTNSDYGGSCGQVFCPTYCGTGLTCVNDPSSWTGGQYCVGSPAPTQGQVCGISQCGVCASGLVCDGNNLCNPPSSTPTPATPPPSTPPPSTGGGGGTPIPPPSPHPA